MTLLPALVTLRDGIPVTTPTRTIADLRRTVATPGKQGAISAKDLRRATRQAEMQGFPLGSDVSSDRTRSDLERDFLRLCRRYRLPAPQVNVRIGRWTVDFVWPVERLAVETDSHRWHRGSVAFEDDHARDLDLSRCGYAVRRFTGRQIREDAARVVADLREALGSAS